MILLFKVISESADLQPIRNDESRLLLFSWLAKAVILTIQYLDSILRIKGLVTFWAEPFRV